MKTVLVVTASPKSDGVSRMLAREFSCEYAKTNPFDEIETLNLAAVSFPIYTEGVHSIITQSGKGFTLDDKRIVAFYNRILHQTLLSDKLVFAFPNWNFLCPPSLVQYITAISRQDIAYKVLDNSRSGLFAGKKALIIMTGYAVYSSCEEPLGLKWLTQCLESLGIEDIQTACAMGIGKGDDDKIIDDCREKIHEIVKEF